MIVINHEGFRVKVGNVVGYDLDGYGLIYDNCSLNLTESKKYTLF